MRMVRTPHVRRPRTRPRNADSKGPHEQAPSAHRGRTGFAPLLSCTVFGAGRRSDTERHRHAHEREARGRDGRCKASGGAGTTASVRTRRRGE